MAKAAMERIVATTVVNFILTRIYGVRKKPGVSKRDALRECETKSPGDKRNVLKVGEWKKGNSKETGLDCWRERLNGEKRMP